MTEQNSLRQPDDFARRLRSFARGRAVAVVLGWGPILALYVLTHTRYLRPYVPESKGMAVVALIVIPISWLVATAYGYRAYGPRLHGLVCRNCGHRLVDDAAKAVQGTGRCPQCDAGVIDVPDAVP